MLKIKLLRVFPFTISVGLTLVVGGERTSLRGVNNFSSFSNQTIFCPRKIILAKNLQNEFPIAPIKKKIRHSVVLLKKKSFLIVRDKKYN